MNLLESIDFYLEKGYEDNNCMTLLSRILTIVGRKTDNIVELSKELMYKQTQINKAPAWGPTELAILIGVRKIEYDETKEKVLKKMEQKRKLLTLDECIKEAETNCNEIIKLFS